MNLLLVTAGLLPLLLTIPPPPKLAEFAPKVQWVTVGLLLCSFNIPPASSVAEFPLNVQWVTVGLPFTFNIPPPRPAMDAPSAFPLVLRCT